MMRPSEVIEESVDTLCKLTSDTTNDNFADIKKMLEALGQPLAGVAINSVGVASGNSPFYTACRTSPVGVDSLQKLRIVELMLSFGADVNGRGDKFENTPLHGAAGCLATNIAILLRRLGADYELVNANRWTPTNVVRDKVDDDNPIIRFRAMTMHKLIEAIQVESTASQPNTPEIHDVFVAIQRRDDSRLKALLAKNPHLVSVTLSDRVRWTPLHLAASLLNVAACQSLVSLSTAGTLSSSDEGGWDPIHWVLIHRCMNAENEAKCQELLKLLESNGRTPAYWARVCRPCGLPELLEGNCYVTEATPDWKGRTNELKSYVVLFEKSVHSEDVKVERYACKVWYDGNPCQDAVGLFEWERKRRLTIREKGRNRSILEEKVRPVFLDDVHDVISMQPTENRLMPSRYAWTGTTIDKDHDWALKKVTSLLPTFFDLNQSGQKNVCLVADGQWEFRPVRIERVSPTIETYAIDVTGRQGMWMLSLVRHNLEHAGTCAIETRLVFKCDGKEEHRCDMTSLVRHDKRYPGMTMRLDRMYVGPTVLHWCATAGLAAWVRVLLEKPGADPFDSSTGGSPYLFTLQQASIVEDQISVLDAQIDALILRNPSELAEDEKPERLKESKNKLLQERSKYREVIDAIIKNKKCAQKGQNYIQGKMKHSVSAMPSLLYYIYELALPHQYFEEANQVLGITTSEAKLFLFHHAIAVGDMTVVDRIKVFLNLHACVNSEKECVGGKHHPECIDGGRRLATGKVEYAVGVAGRFGRLELIKYLHLDNKCKLDAGDNMVLCEAMKGGHIVLGDWVLQQQNWKPGGPVLECLPSATGTPGAEDGMVTSIPCIEELQFCADRDLVTTQHLENVLMRSFHWENAAESRTIGSAVPQNGTAVLLQHLQNDKIEHQENREGKTPLAPVSGTDKAWLDKITNFLDACLLDKTTIKIDHIVCVNMWHPDDHCSFKESPLQRDPESGADPRKRLKQCVQHTWGAEVHPVILGKIGDVTKHSRCGVDGSVDVQSGFFENNQQSRTGLHDLLQSLNVRTLIIVGLPFDTAVRFTVADAMFLGYEVTVVEDLCPGRDFRDSFPRDFRDCSEPESVVFARQDMMRRGARVISERKLYKKAEQKDKDKQKPASHSMKTAIRFLLNIPNVRYHILFEQGMYAKNFRQLVDGMDFGFGARSGQLFLYLATLVAIRGVTALAKGFTIENTRFESGDYEALRFPLHYLLMRCKFAPTALERRAANNLLMKVISFINETTIVKLDANGNRTVKFPGGKSPRDFATWRPLQPCEKRIDEAMAIGDGKSEKDRCKCIFHVPLRAFKPNMSKPDEIEWMLEEVRVWDLWDEGFFQGKSSCLKKDKAKIARPQCPVGLRTHVFPRQAPKETDSPSASANKFPIETEETCELQHLLCCTPLNLAVRLNLYDVVEQMVCNKENPGVVSVGRCIGKDATGDSFEYEDLEDVWQAIPYERKVDGTMTLVGTPALHFALRAMREPHDLNHFPALRKSLVGCIVDKERSLTHFMKDVIKRVKAHYDGEGEGSPHKGYHRRQEVNQVEDDEDVSDIPFQDCPLDIAKGSAALFEAGMEIQSWNTDEHLELERYRSLTHTEPPALKPSDEDRKIVWAIPTEKQWLCADCGCCGNDVIVPSDSAERTERQALQTLVDYLCALRVCVHLLRSSCATMRFLERAGEAVNCIRVDVGPSRQRLIGTMFDRAGVFELSGFGWVERLQKYEVGDSGLSLILQYAPQLISHVLSLNLLEKCPIDTYDDLNNLVNRSSAAIMIQRRHLWKAARGGVELCVYDKGLSLLHWAALLNDDAFVKLLIHWGANPVNTPLSARLGYSPIHYCCYSAAVGVLRCIMNNVVEERGSEAAERYANLQATPRVIDQGLLTYNALHFNKRKCPTAPKTIRDMVLSDRKSDPSAWPKKTRSEQINDLKTLHFYGPVNTFGETALHVAAAFCHQMCVCELTVAYHADVGIRSTLEGFDPHDIAAALLHKAELQIEEDNMSGTQKNADTQISEKKDLKTLESMSKYMNAQDSVLVKLKGYSVKNFINEARTYICFTVMLTILGFLMADINVTGGSYWSNQAVRNSVLGEAFKINYHMNTSKNSEPAPPYGSQWRADSTELGELADVSGWINGPLRSKFFAVDSAAGETQSSKFVLENKYRIVGAIRIAVLRVKNGSNCGIPKEYSNQIFTCYPDYTASNGLTENKVVVDASGNLTTIPYGRWDFHRYMPPTVMGSPWNGMQSAVTEKYFPTQIGNYIDISPGPLPNLDAKFALVENLLTIDVRFVSVVFNLYAVNMDRFVVGEVFFEAPLEAAISMTTRFTIVRLNRYTNQIDYFRLFLELVIFIMLMSFFNEEIVEIFYMVRMIHLKWRLLDMRREGKVTSQDDPASLTNKMRAEMESTQTVNYDQLKVLLRSGFANSDANPLRSESARHRTFAVEEFEQEEPMYVCPKRMQLVEEGLWKKAKVAKFFIVIEDLMHHFTSDWNFIDIMILVLMIVCIGFHIHMFSVENTVQNMREMETSEYIESLPAVAFYASVQMKILSFCILIAWIKILKYVKLLPNTGPIAAAIVGTVGHKQIYTFSIILSIVIMAFVFACYLSFQSNVEGMRTFRLTFFFVVRMIVGDSDFAALARDPHLGTLMWLLVVFFVVIMLLNILIAVVSNVFQDLINGAEAEWAADVCSCYRQDILGLPSLDRPFGSFFVQWVRLLLGQCIPSLKRTYLMNRFVAIPEEEHAEVDNILGIPLYPHLRKWDCVSTTVVEKMEQYNFRLNLSNENLQDAIDVHGTTQAARLQTLERKVDDVMSKVDAQGAMLKNMLDVLNKDHHVHSKKA